MEEKLLKLLKMANTLDEKQDKLYAQIEYCADHTKKLGASWTASSCEVRVYRS